MTCSSGTSLGWRRVHGAQQTHNKNEKLSQVMLYFAGFPCKAFSRLRHVSLLLRDPQAKQFFEVIRTVRRVKPVVSCLEVSLCDSDPGLPARECHGDPCGPPGGGEPYPRDAS